jgi:hypothetical protein
MSHKIAWTKLTMEEANVLRELRSVSGEELSAIMPSVLDRAFKGEM